VTALPVVVSSSRVADQPARALVTCRGVNLTEILDDYPAVPLPTIDRH
jgi:hypothetical protein